MRIEKCNKCGENGVPIKQCSRWYIMCVGKGCRNRTKIHITRFGAIYDWNSIVDK